MTREEALKILICRSGWNLSICDIKALDMAIKALEQEPQTFEWCHDCKEYDHEKHCCPRYNKVIRNTVEEIKQPCEDAISRESAQEGLTHLMDSDGFRDSVGYVQKSLVRKMLNDLPTVQPKPIECEDAISMMDLLNNLHKHFSKGFETDEWWNSTHVLQAVKDCRPELFDLNYVPSVQPKPKIGQWVLLDECSNSGYYCSYCHKKLVKEGWSNTVKKIKYCPNCGSRMKMENGET